MFQDLSVVLLGLANPVPSPAPTPWYNQPIVVAAVSIVGTFLLTKFFPALWAQVVRLGNWIWALIQGRGTEHDFEMKYLNWLIGQYRHLGLIPAQVVVRRWGERQKVVDLEDVYVRLALEAHSGDDQWAQS